MEFKCKKCLIENKSQRKNKWQILSLQLCFRSFNDTANGEHKRKKKRITKRNEKGTITKLMNRFDPIPIFLTCSIKFQNVKITNQLVHSTSI